MPLRPFFFLLLALSPPVVGGPATTTAGGGGGGAPACDGPASASLAGSPPKTSSAFVPDAEAAAARRARSAFSLSDDVDRPSSACSPAVVGDSGLAVCDPPGPAAEEEANGVKRSGWIGVDRWAGALDDDGTPLGTADANAEAGGGERIVPWPTSRCARGTSTMRMSSSSSSASDSSSSPSDSLNPAPLPPTRSPSSAPWVDSLGELNQ